MKRTIEALSHAHKMRAFHLLKSCFIGVVG